jgi:hypothetical protein
MPFNAEAATPNPGPTGPRTQEGKLRSRTNSFRHGLTGQTIVFSEEDAPVFQKHHAALRAHYRPASPVEDALVDSIASAMWRLQRAHAIEEGIFAAQSMEPTEDAAGAAVSLHLIPGPARIWLEQGKSLDLLGKYERRIRRDLDRDKAELASLQTARASQPKSGTNELPARKPFDLMAYLDAPTPSISPVAPPTLDRNEAVRRRFAAAQTRAAELRRNPAGVA